MESEELRGIYTNAENAGSARKDPTRGSPSKGIHASRRGLFGLPPVGSAVDGLVEIVWCC